MRMLHIEQHKGRSVKIGIAAQWLHNGRGEQKAEPDRIEMWPIGKKIATLHDVASKTALLRLFKESRKLISITLSVACQQSYTGVCDQCVYGQV